MQHIILLILGILLIIGGIFTYRHTQRYVKLNGTSKTVSSNQWRGFALSYGYIGAGALVVVGVILLIVSMF